MSKVKRTERGWAGHFICADRCTFRRNTLLEKGKVRYIVSTVGGMLSNGVIDTIGGGGRYYETVAFKAKKKGPYWEIDVSKELSFESEWAICADKASALSAGVDNQADTMHEDVVAELSKLLEEK